MSDWRLLAVALAFVYAMARLTHVNRRAMKFGGLLVLALAGYKTVPMIAAGVAPLASAPVEVVEVSTEQESSDGPSSDRAEGDDPDSQRLRELYEAKAQSLQHLRDDPMCAEELGVLESINREIEELTR